jgi:pimeloyl-ACP methyl ester carboxylesterase
LLLLLTATVALLLCQARARAQIHWTPCGNTNDFACGHLTVPVDPGAPGSGEAITLAMRRHLAPVGEAKDAVIALAGGPGQAAIPFVEEFDRLLGPIAATRDLIVLDQRGTGLSHSLSCAAFERLAGHAASPSAIGICGDQLGAARAFYRTADTVADIEAIRRAGGYEKLVLYGTSYGTKVAERYAQAYPTHVEALVLDSVVTPNGPDPLARTSFAAIRRILRTLCAEHACARITRDPVSDLSRLVATIGHHGPLRIEEVGDEGELEPATVSTEDLLDVLYAGDFNPFLRAELPAAVRSADEGDEAALARMLRRARGGEGGGPENLVEGFDMPLFYATTCEEEPFPWSREASPATRTQKALAYVHSLPAAMFAPFTGSDALDSGSIRSCASWPFSSAAPESDESPLPAVPTLIFSGEADLRTPTANAQQVAREIPGAQLLVVPHTGHSVLGAALGGCPRKALQAFFAGRRIAQCRGANAPPAPPVFPRAPRRLGAVKPAPENHGLAGRALAATILTLEDFERQSELQFITQLGGRTFLGLFELRVGGLRGGWAKLDEKRLTLHRYTYVPGVSLSGRLTDHGGLLHLGGADTIRGTLRLDRRHRLIGTLGGAHVATARPVSTP